MSAEVICGDCLEVMPTLADASVDLILTDPPYFRVKDEPWDRAWDSPDAFLAWMGKVADEWQRILKPNGSLMVFASPQMAGRVEAVIAGRFNVLNSITWAKPDPFSEINRGAGNGGRISKESLRSFYPNTERIIFAEHKIDEYAEMERLLHIEVFSVVGARIAALRERAGLERWQIDVACSPSRKPTGLCYRWESGDCLPSREQFDAICAACNLPADYGALCDEYKALQPVFESRRAKIEDRRRPFFAMAGNAYTDVWAFGTVGTYAGKHVCEKPIALIEHAIRTTTRPDALVLDTFAGSGTTLEAARNLGRRSIGIEKSPQWCAYIRERLAQETLFGEVA